MKVLNITKNGAIKVRHLLPPKTTLSQILKADEVAEAQFNDDYNIYYDSYAKHKHMNHTLNWEDAKIYGPIVFKRRDNKDITDDNIKEIFKLVQKVEVL